MCGSVDDGLVQRLIVVCIDPDHATLELLVETLDELRFTPACFLSSVEAKEYIGTPGREEMVQCRAINILLAVTQAPGGSIGLVIASMV